MRVSSVCRQPPSERDVEDFDPGVVYYTNTQGPAVCKIISPRKDPGNKVSFSKKHFHYNPESTFSLYYRP